METYIVRWGGEVHPDGGSGLRCHRPAYLVVPVPRAPTANGVSTTASPRRLEFPRGPPNRGSQRKAPKLDGGNAHRDGENVHLDGDILTIETYISQVEANIVTVETYIVTVETYILTGTT